MESTENKITRIKLTGKNWSNCALDVKTGNIIEVTKFRMTHIDLGFFKFRGNHWTVTNPGFSVEVMTEEAIDYTKKPNPNIPIESIVQKSTRPLDFQIGGNHYKDLVIQPIEYITKNNLNFCQGNAIKYITRYKAKNGLEDLKKAKHYIDLLIDHEYGGEKL